jgi:hypothetical protein
MHFPWPAIVEQASRDAELMPGDLLGSGTVGTGCILELGPEVTGGWLRAGDVVELEIEKIGVLRTPIVGRRKCPKFSRAPEGVYSRPEGSAASRENAQSASLRA